MPVPGDLLVRDKTVADQPWVEGLLEERWGATIVVVHGSRFDAAALPALVAGDRQGLATYRVDGHAELVTLDAVARGGASARRCWPNWSVASAPSASRACG